MRSADQFEAGEIDGCAFRVMEVISFETVTVDESLVEEERIQIVIGAPDMATLAKAVKKYGIQNIDVSKAQRIAVCMHGANSRLIAAAPEMLEILEELALYPEARSYPDGPCLRSEDMEEIDRIIAKATGKEVE